jgi:DNA-binding NarL/FixJ family response regulator
MPDEQRRTWLEVHRVTQERIEARRQRLDALTDREFEVLRLLERGHKAGDIARHAVLSIATVRTHIRSILRKLEVNSQQQAIEFYREARRR